MFKGKKLNLRTSDRIVLIIVLVLTALIVVLSLMQRAGLAPVHGSLMLYLPALIVVLLVGWGLYTLIRRIRRDTLRRVLIGLLVAALLLVGSLGLTYLNLMSTISIPQKYNVFTSPGGTHKLVLLRGLDLDEERLAARKAARLAANPDDTDENVAEDMGYVYKAYPLALAGLFYRTDADVEGTASIGYGSTGTLMMEWPDEDTAHFYVKDPGPADGGEVTVKFK